MKEKIMKILEENCESLAFKKMIRNDEDEDGSNWNHEHFFQSDLLFSQILWGKGRQKEEN